MALLPGDLGGGQEAFLGARGGQSHSSGHALTRAMVGVQGGSESELWKGLPTTRKSRPPSPRGTLEYPAASEILAWSLVAPVRPAGAPDPFSMG